MSNHEDEKTEEEKLKVIEEEERLEKEKLEVIEDEERLEKEKLKIIEEEERLEKEKLKLFEDEERENKERTIIVNSRVQEWPEKYITYEQIITLAFGTISNGPNTVYTVTYTRGYEPKDEGSLVKGQKVKVKKGMIFNATQTNKS